MRKIFLRILFVGALSVATATITLPSTTISAGPKRGCCAHMAHESNSCPLQPMNGMSSSCCTVPLCLHLFLQTSEVRLDPGCADLEWNSFAEREVRRADRPAVPPPRVAVFTHTGPPLFPNGGV